MYLVHDSGEGRFSTTRLEERGQRKKQVTYKLKEKKNQTQEEQLGGWMLVYRASCNSRPYLAETNFETKLVFSYSASSKTSKSAS